MKFTQEQIDEIPKFYIDDYPLDFDSWRFQMINDMPRWLQGHVIAGDAEEEIFEWLCRNQLGLSIKEYYDSKVAKNYFENNILIEYKPRKLEE